MSDTEPRRASVPLTLARVGAVALAIAVVAVLIWRAQDGAERPEAPPRAAGGEGAAPTDGAFFSDGGDDDVDELLLRSSKSFVVDEKHLMPSSKFAPLPSSKSIVIPLEEAERNSLLFSSKSGAPIEPPKAPKLTAPAQTGGGQ